MATVVAAYEESSDYWATWSHVFQGANTVWLGFDTRQILGNFFLGLQGQSSNIWNTQIPPGSTILSATMEFTPFSSNFNLSYDATMVSPNRALDTHAQLPIQKPFSRFRGWRPDIWSNMSMIILSTTFTNIATSGTATNVAWIHKQLVGTGSDEVLGWREMMAQGFTTGAAGNLAIASVTLEMNRVGLPAPGAIRVGIYTAISNRGILEPGVLLGYSSDVAYSTLSVAPIAGPVPFGFGGSLTLDPSTNYFMVVESDYPAGLGAYIQTRSQNAFLTTGRQMHFGDGTALDWQNYPGTVDLNQSVHLLANLLPTEVTWPIDSVTVGATETSPDISAMLQEQIDAVGYTIDSGIIIGLQRFTPTAQNRIMRSNTNAPGPGPVLRVTYEEPVPVVEAPVDDVGGWDPRPAPLIRVPDRDIIAIAAGAMLIENENQE